MANDPDNLHRIGFLGRDDFRELVVAATRTSRLRASQSRNDVPPGSDALESLYVSICKVIHQFTISQPAQTSPTQSDPPTFLDFSLSQLTRRNRDPLPLARALYVRMLEQLSRRPVLSLARFLLLSRYKQSATYGDRRPPSDALRHELSELRRRLREFDLPVDIERHGQGIIARFDIRRLRANTIDAQSLAKKAFAGFSIFDFSGAVEFAKRALQMDFDCVAAASLVARIAQAGQPYLDADVVVRAEMCLARMMLCCASGIQRLRRSDGRYDTNVAKALEMAERMLTRLRRHWNALGAWPFGEAPNDRGIRDYRAALRDLLELVIEARRGGDRIEFRRFVANRIANGVVDRLLAGRVQEMNPRRRQEAEEALRVEVLCKVTLTSWSPSPALSEQLFQHQLVQFLQARRIDWRKVLNKTRSRTVLFRDDVHELDDGDDDDQ